MHFNCPIREENLEPEKKQMNVTRKIFFFPVILQRDQQIVSDFDKWLIDLRKWNREQVNHFVLSNFVDELS